MIRDMSFAHFLGAGGVMDSWVIAFQIPNLSRRLFGEGAASASLMPVYRRQLEEDPQGAAKLANTVVTVIFVLLSAIVLISWLGLSVYTFSFAKNSETKIMLSLVSVMLPYMVMICTVAILAGILNTHKHFVSPAVAPILLNIFIISAVLVTGWAFSIPPVKQVFVIAAAVLAAGLAQIAIQVPALRAKSVIVRPAWDIHSQSFRRVIFLMAPMIIGITATQLNTLADTWIARFFSGSAEKGDFLTLLGMQLKYPLWDGAVSHLYYSQRLYQFPLGVLGISLATAIFPVMSSDVAKNDFDALKKTISQAAKGAVFISIPAIAGLILVAKPLVSVVFERGVFSAVDTQATARILLFYALGLCGFFSQQILARGFYAMQDSAIPMRSALIAVGINIVLNLTLIWFMGTAGLALSTAICSYLQVIILIIALRKKLGGSILDGLFSTSAKTFISTSLMAAVGVGIMFLMKDFPDKRWFNVLRLAAVVPSAAGVYLLTARILDIEALSLIGGRKRTKT